MPQGFHERIAIDPKVMGGKPVIQGTRIPVDLLVRMVAQGIPTDDILTDYPALHREDIQAALAHSAISDQITSSEHNRLIELAHEAGLTYLAIFGSAARGEARPDSDVDLAVRFGRRITLFGLVDLKRQFQEIVKKPVDLIPVDDIYPFMRESLERDSIVLLDTVAEVAV